MTDQPGSDSDLRRRAAWLLAMLAVVAVLFVLLLTTLLDSGGASNNNANPDGTVPASASGSTPATTVTSSASSPRSTPSTKSSTSTATSTSATTSAPASGTKTCPTTAKCALEGDYGNAVDAINAYRTQHGKKAVPGTVSKAAQDCAKNNGSGCKGGWAESQVPDIDGDAAVKKVQGLGKLLDPMTSFSVGWAYDPGSRQYFFAVIRHS